MTNSHIFAELYLCSFMNLTGLLALVPSWRHLSWLLQAVLVVGLCCCMLWQCTTCLLKYLASPTGATVAYNSDLTQIPLSVTFCPKGPELNYSFPELVGLDARPGPGADWQTIWTGGPLAAAAAKLEPLITINSWMNLRLCRSVHLDKTSASSELRIRHYYNICKKNMQVFLHPRGLFFATDFSLPLDKDLFSEEYNVILDLAMETLDSLPSPELNCNSANEAQTLDSCLLAEAARTANQSAGCVSKWMG